MQMGLKTLSDHFQELGADFGEECCGSRRNKKVTRNQNFSLDRGQTSTSIKKSISPMKI